MTHPAFRLRAAAWLAGLWVLLAMAASPASTAELPPEISQTLEVLASKEIAAGAVGVQAFVAVGDASWAFAGGFSNLEREQKLSLDDRMRTASLTKLLTYAVTMELVGEGRLKLEAPASHYLPKGFLDGIPYADEFTIGQLLDHQTGVFNFNGDYSSPFYRDLFSDPHRGEAAWSIERLLSYARQPDNPPAGRPGEGTWYSSTGYIILEAALSHVTGKPISRLYEDYLFAPLGMSRTGVEGAGLEGVEIADSYAVPSEDDPAHSPFDGRRPVRADGLTNLSGGLRTYNAWARAAGAVASTAPDLAKFMRAVRHGDLTIFRDQESEVAKARERPKARFDWNGGSWGIRATILYSPAHDAVVVVIENSSTPETDSHALALGLLRAATEK